MLEGVSQMQRKLLTVVQLEGHAVTSVIYALFEYIFDRGTGYSYSFLEFICSFDTLTIIKLINVNSTYRNLPQ